MMGNRSALTLRAALGERLTALTVSWIAAAVVCAVYLVHTPLSPDLAAQLARADLVRRAGDVAWWTGWFGGLSLPTYSLITPAAMAAFGVTVTGAASTVAGCLGAGVLLEDSPRPRVGALVFAVFAAADLYAGRVTFVVGAACLMWALAGVRRHWRVRTLVATSLAFLGSPLAGLFLGLILLAVVLTDRSRRWLAATACGALLVAATAMALLFPGTGVMPFHLTDAVPPALGSLAVAVLCRQRTVRAAAVISLAALPAFLFVPGAIGSNIARLAWVGAVPAVVACSTLDRKRLAAVAVALSVWPAADVVSQVHWTPGVTAAPAYYRPLVARLRAVQASAGQAAVGLRVELLDPKDHTGSLVLSRTFALARGWDRQADAANNPIFYRPGALTAASYDGWLHDLAVGWVAVPSTALDYGATREAALIGTGLPYLRPVWSSPDWHLYRVVDPSPLVAGAQALKVGPSRITIRAAGPGVVDVRTNWTPYLLVTDATGHVASACVQRTADGIRVRLPAAGVYDVAGPFDATAPFRSADTDCADDPHAAG